MKRGIVILALVALIATPALARNTGAVQNTIRDLQYTTGTWWGNRDPQAYGGGQLEFAQWEIDPFTRCTIDTHSQRVTPGTTVTLDTVRTSWASGGGGKGNVQMWIDTNAVAPNYHPTAGGYPAVAEYTGGWNIPAGAPISGVATTYATGANETLDFVLPAPVTLNAGQIYHIIYYVDMSQDGVGVEGEVDPNTGVVAGKLRIKQMNLQPCGDFPWPVNPYKGYYLRDGNIKNQGNYRNADGQALNGGTGSNVAVGDDGMAHLYYLNTDLAGVQHDKWVEGSLHMEGYNSYAKYSEPYFDTLLEEQPTGFGQGHDATVGMAVTPNPQGEQFVAPANVMVDSVAMYIRKADLDTTADLSLQLRDSAGAVLAAGTRTAASIPDAWDLPIDPVSYPQPPDEHQRWGWIVVDLDRAINVVGGQSYQVTCTTTDDTGTAYQFRVQDDGAIGRDIMDPASGFQGTAGFLVGSADDTKDALFLIPEPATMSLLVLGGLAVLRRRRR